MVGIKCLESCLFVTFVLFLDALYVVERSVTILVLALADPHDII